MCIFSTHTMVNIWLSPHGICSREDLESHTSWAQCVMSQKPFLTDVSLLPAVLQKGHNYSIPSSSLQKLIGFWILNQNIILLAYKCQINYPNKSIQIQKGCDYDRPVLFTVFLSHASRLWKRKIVCELMLHAHPTYLQYQNKWLGKVWVRGFDSFVCSQIDPWDLIWDLSTW